MAALNVGEMAPEFSLKNQKGETVRLSDFKGQNVLIYFYPKADTPGCTIQSCAVRDALPDLASSGAAAIGISPDDPAAQDAFDRKFELGFPLLCDEDHAVAEAYGVWDEKSKDGRAYMGIVRSAFLVGKDGKLVQVWYDVSPEDTVPNAIQALG